MLFNFELHPIELIATLSATFGGDQPYLSWYKLTDGYYWLEADGVEVLRASDTFLAARKHVEPYPPRRPYVDYYVVRLWEDLLDLLPAVLEPLPAPLAARLTPEHNWQRWWDQVDHWADCSESDEDLDTFALAVDWWRHDRWLNTSHLRYGPDIWLWSDGRQVWLRWDTGGVTHEGVPVWTATAGAASFPVHAFIAEVRSFDERLMRAMDERVRAARAAWPRPDVAVDLERLGEEQIERSRWGPAAFQAAQTREPTDWQGVLDAIATLDERFPFPEGQRSR